MKNKTKITKLTNMKVWFDDEHTPEETLNEILRLMAKGYKSGVYPRWETYTK